MTTEPSGEPGAQTLSRGIRILEFLAERAEPATIPAIVEGLGLHRSIVYRLLRTLEQHRLVERDERGRIRLGVRLASLAAAVDRDVQAAAGPALQAAANELGATCFLVELDRGEAVTLMSVEPRRSAVTVAQHPGTTHPLGVGAPGRAVLVQLPEQDWPEALDPARAAATREVRSRGYAVSRDEVIAGLRSVALPVPLERHRPLAIAVVYVTLSHDEADIAARLEAAAAQIRAALAV